MSFATVTVGNATLATDINQYANVLNGTTAGPVVVSGGANANTPYTAKQNSVGATQSVFYAALINADTKNRVEIIARNSDNYGGLNFSNGSTVTAHLYAQASGLKLDESLTVTGSVTAAGAGSFAGLTSTSTLSSDGGKILSDGAGHLTLNGDRVVTASAACKIWVQTTDPAGLSANGDLWVNV
jgi:hypothetical protein